MTKKVPNKEKLQLQRAQYEAARAKFKTTKLAESINSLQDLHNKTQILSSAEIFDFMKNIRGGTYFNFSMFSEIPVYKKFESIVKIYAVHNYHAVVSGVNYENLKAIKDFRAETGEETHKPWYAHVPNRENRIAVHRSEEDKVFGQANDTINPDVNMYYMLWDYKDASSGVESYYYIADLENNNIKRVYKQDLIDSSYLTATAKNALQPKPLQGIAVDTNTKQPYAIECRHGWRTTKFDHVFYLAQKGAGTHGQAFEEDLNTDLAIIEPVTRPDFAAKCTEITDNAEHINIDAFMQNVLKGNYTEAPEQNLDGDTLSDYFTDWK